MKDILYKKNITRHNNYWSILIRIHIRKYFKTETVIIWMTQRRENLRGGRERERGPKKDGRWEDTWQKEKCGPKKKEKTGRRHVTQSQKHSHVTSLHSFTCVELVFVTTFSSFVIILSLLFYHLNIVIFFFLFFFLKNTVIFLLCNKTKFPK